MENDGQAARDGDNRAPHTPALGDLHPPGLKPRPMPALSHQDLRRFICHRSELRAELNREHILPNWHLREFGLHRVSVTLPNRELHGHVTEVGWRRSRSLAPRPLVTIADPGLRPRGEVR